MHVVLGGSQFNALEIASVIGDLELVKLILRHGCSLADSVHLACAYDHLPIVQHFVSARSFALPERASTSNHSAIECAAWGAPGTAKRVLAWLLKEYPVRFCVVCVCVCMCVRVCVCGLLHRSIRFFVATVGLIAEIVW